MEQSSDSTNLPILYRAPFIYALVYPILIWGLMIALSLTARQPGVVCITPVAWVLAFWSGVHYVRRCGGRPGRFPLLGPALLGAALGLAMGLIFLVVIYWNFPPATPEDSLKTGALILVMLAGGVLACAAFCSLTAWLTYRKYARAQ